MLEPTHIPTERPPMSDLSSLLLESKRPQVVKDLTTLVDNTVAKQSGFSGAAVKTAVAAGRRIDADIVPKSVNRLLPDILGDLQQHWAAYAESDHDDFGEYLEPRAKDVAESLMGSADRAVQKAGVGAIEKIYSPFRGRGAKIIAPQVPELGAVIERHMVG